MEQILQYRTKLMSVAILAIIACHLFQLYPVMPWIRFGSIGVEIFFFLSGMGLVFSLRRNGNVLQFYGRRALRILPSYYLVLFLEALLIGSAVLCWPSLCLYGKFRWFIGTICLFYLLFPAYMALCRRISPVWVYTAICCVVAACFLCLQPWIEPRWFARAPVFFLGCLCVQSEHILSRRRTWVLVALVALALFGYCNTQRDLYGPLGALALLRTLFTPGCCLLLAWCFKQCEKVRIGRVLMVCVGVYGALSLEVYLLEGTVRPLVNRYLGVEYWPLEFVFILPLAYAVNWLSKRIQGLFKRKDAAAAAR